MDGKKSSFWPSYVDIMTTLFAIMLILFAVSYSRFKIKNQQLQALVDEYENIITVYDAVSTIDSTEYFDYNNQFLKHLFTVDVEYQEKEYQINRLQLDLKNAALANAKRDSIKSAGDLIVKTISKLEDSISSNSKSNNIKFLVIIEGQASKIKFDQDDWHNNYTLSYLRARFLNEFWISKGIDIANLPKCELIISGSGEKGVPRYIPNEAELKRKYPNPQDYWANWKIEEGRNQRFLIHIVPVIGNIDVTQAKIQAIKGNKSNK